MRERVIQALLVFVGDISSQSKKYYENMKFHNEGFRASDPANVLTLRALASSLCALFMYLEHLYLWHDPLMKGCPLPFST